MLLVKLPLNPFYMEYAPSISAILSSCILEWRAATKIENEAQRSLSKAQRVSSLRVAFYTRSSYHNLITHCALLIGGVDWAASVAEDISRLAYNEPFDEYLKEMGVTNGD